jgi:hypothetical protein
MGKRKGDDVLVGDGAGVGISHANTASPGSSLSGSTPLQNSSNNSCSNDTSAHFQPAWLDSASFDHKLWVVRESLKLDKERGEEEDVFLAEIRNCKEKMHTFQRQREDLIQVSTAIQEKLTKRINVEEAKCQKESENVQAIEQELIHIQQERDSLVREMTDLEKMRKELEQQIASAIEEANKEVEAIDLVEENRKNTVPRLKHQISLYAATTGLKWEFENDHLLEGHVVSTVQYSIWFLFLRTSLLSSCSTNMSALLSVKVDSLRKNNSSVFN